MNLLGVAYFLQDWISNEKSKEPINLIVNNTKNAETKLIIGIKSEISHPILSSNSSVRKNSVLIIVIIITNFFNEPYSIDYVSKYA